VAGVRDRALSWPAPQIAEDTPGTALGTARGAYLCDEARSVGTQNTMLEKLSDLEPRNLMIEVRFFWITKIYGNLNDTEMMAHFKNETEEGVI